MASPTISSFSPTSANWGDVVTITGTNFDNPNVTDVTVNGISVPWIIIDSGTQIRIPVPTASTGELVVTNADGSGDSSLLSPSDLTVSEESSGYFTVVGAGASGQFTIALIKASGSFNIAPPGASGSFTVGVKRASGSFTIAGAPASGSFTVGVIKASGSFTIAGAVASGSFTILSEDKVFDGALSFSKTYDCSSFTVSDSTDYDGNGETRGDFNLSLKVSNTKSGKEFQLSPNDADSAVVSSWTGSVDSDGVYNAILFHNSSVVRSIDNFLVLCASDKYRNEIETDYIDSIDCKNCDDVYDYFLRITALHDMIVASFRAKKFILANSLIDDLKLEYIDYSNSKKRNLHVK